MIPIDLHRLPQWLLELFHVDPERLPANAEAWISLKRFPESGWGLLAVVALLAGFAAIGWTYRREGALARRRKIALAGVRCIVLFVLALILFYPVLEVSVEREQEAVTLVLIDDSLSFGIADPYPAAALRQRIAKAAGASQEELGKLPRAEIARRLLASPEARFLPRLSEKNLLKIYTFSDGLRPAGQAGGADPAGAETAGQDPSKDLATLEIKPRGSITDLGGALRAAVEAQGNVPVAAVVVLTDGKATAGEDPAGVGRYLGERKIPVYSIGIGDPSPLKNLRLLAVFAPERVFAGDPVSVDVRLEHRGYKGETATVELARDGEVLKSAEVKLEDSAEVTARLEISLKKPGEERLAARVARKEGEMFENDNERSLVIEVVDQATRVLLIAGGPSNEFRILKNLLRRDKRTHLASWLMSADPESPQEGDTVLKKLPAAAKEMFEYDVVLLLDVHPDGLPAGFAGLLESFAGKHRGGVGTIAGEKFTARFFRAAEMEPVRALLPVIADLPAADEEFGRGNFYQKEWPVSPTSDALLHASTRLSSHPDRNRELWAELPGIYWSFPVQKPKPGATVLLTHPDPRFAVSGGPRPLLAYQFYEGGRSLFLGFDETWRWRAVSEEIYDRFWMQLVRTLAEGRLLGDRRQLILSDRDRYDLGEVVRLSAMVQDENYRPSAADSVVLEVASQSGAREQIPLEKDPAQEGWFRGIYVPREIGPYRFQLIGAGAAAGKGAEKTVSVEIPDLEYQDPRLDEVALKDLAALTQGAYATPENYRGLPDQIPSRRQKVVTADEPRPLWDNAAALLLVVSLLAAEWIARKWNRLP